MIPAYNPPAGYLRETLESVLRQDPGPNRMQIEVVDDQSTKADVTALVHSIAGDRVAVSKTPINLGLAGCWNTCIQRASGDWVHLLHQDDWVLPGFYRRFEALVSANPALDAACCRQLDADGDGHWTYLSPLMKREPGPLDNFSGSLARHPTLQCPAVIVRRQTYQRLGLFRADLPYVLDWEMWSRIAANGTWGYEPTPGAVYRMHSGSETQRLKRSGVALRNLLEGGMVARSHFSPALQAETRTGFLGTIAGETLKLAVAQFVSGDNRGAALTLDSFRREVFAGGRSLDWIRLRLRIAAKSFRGAFSR
jgi:glycosyltransferase involved in cell wall biosynthesis